MRINSVGWIFRRQELSADNGWQKHKFFIRVVRSSISGQKLIRNEGQQNDFRWSQEQRLLWPLHNRGWLRKRGVEKNWSEWIRLILSKIKPKNIVLGWLQRYLLWPVCEPFRTTRKITFWTWHRWTQVDWKEKNPWKESNRSCPKLSKRR